METLLAQLIDPVLHPRLLRGAGQERLRARIIGSISAVTIGGVLIDSIVRAAMGQSSGLLSRLLILIACLPLPLLLRRGVKLTITRAYLLTVGLTIITVLVVRSGGATSKGLYLFALVPVLAAVLGSQWERRLWFFVSFFLVLVFYGLAFAGITLPVVAGAHVSSVDFTSLAIGMTLVFVVVRLLVDSRRKMGRTLRAITTEVEEANARIHAAQVSLKRAGAAKALLLKRVSRSFRAPIERLTRDARAIHDQLPLDLREYAQMIRASGQRLLDKLEDVVLFTDTLSMPAVGHERPFDLVALVHDVAQRVERSAEAKGLTLSVGAAIQHHWRRGDRDRLTSILASLVANAVKFTERGLVSIRVAEVDDPRAAAQGRVRFVVEDSGIGIPQHEHEHIFEALVQADASTVRRHEGAGLGLAIARRLAESLGSKIELSSEVGVGSRFSFVVSLPVVTSTQASAVAKRAMGRSARW